MIPAQCLHAAAFAYWPQLWNQQVKRALFEDSSFESCALEMYNGAHLKNSALTRAV